jgi:hypothetical protein
MRIALLATVIATAFVAGGLAAARADTITQEQLDCLYGFCGPRTEEEQLEPEEPTLYLNANDATPRRGQRVRFHGELYPERNGRSVYIQKRVRGGYRTVARTVLRKGGDDGLDTWSTYSVRIRVSRNGLYRAHVPRSGDRPAVTSFVLDVFVHD